MIKIQPNTNQGIEYIRISELPISQHRNFQKWISKSSIFEVVYEQKVYNDCVMYSEYEFWFETQSYEYSIKENLLF